MTKQMKADADMHMAALEQTSANLRAQQGRLHAIRSGPKSFERFRTELEQEMGLERLWQHFSSYIEQNATDVGTLASDIHRDNMELENIIAGYRERLGSADKGASKPRGEPREEVC